MCEHKQTMTEVVEDDVWLKQTLTLSSDSVSKGNHPFGALLVIQGEKVLEARNTVNTESDPSCHAEMNLVRMASKTLSAERRHQAVLYTSTEPCAMCAGAIYWSGIKQIVYACSGDMLNEIAGKSLVCHSAEVYKGAIEPPTVKASNSKTIIDQAQQQHALYWTQTWSDM